MEHQDYEQALGVNANLTSSWHSARRYIACWAAGLAKCWA